MNIWLWWDINYQVLQQDGWMYLFIFFQEEEEEMDEEDDVEDEEAPRDEL